MRTTEIITSAQNPKIKNLLLLQEKSRARREQGLFVVEGRRELEHCMEAGYNVRTVFVCPEICPEQRSVSGTIATLGEREGPTKWEGSRSDGDGNTYSAKEVKTRVYEITPELYRKAAYRESTEGIIAEVEVRTLSLEDLQLPENPLIAVLESVEKPGNLGAVLRSADAAKADAVIVCDPLTDIYNPNLIRASIGAVFTVPTVCASSEDTIDFLKKKGIQILTAQLQDSSLYYDCDMRRGTAIVMGTESTGLSQAWRKAASSHIRIPMLGRLDSLNVSVSAAILLFEAVRQRSL